MFFFGDCSNYRTADEADDGAQTEILSLAVAAPLFFGDRERLSWAVYVFCIAETVLFVILLWTTTDISNDNTWTFALAVAVSIGSGLRCLFLCFWEGTGLWRRSKERSDLDSLIYELLFADAVQLILFSVFGDIEAAASAELPEVEFTRSVQCAVE